MKRRFCREIQITLNLAYPEYSLQVRDKIAFAQFIVGIHNTELKRVFQLEGIVSLSSALARTLEVKSIKDRNKLCKNDS